MSLHGCECWAIRKVEDGKENAMMAYRSEPIENKDKRRSKKNGGSEDCRASGNHEKTKVKILWQCDKKEENSISKAMEMMVNDRRPLGRLRSGG